MNLRAIPMSELYQMQTALRSDVAILTAQAGIGVSVDHAKLNAKQSALGAVNAELNRRLQQVKEAYNGR